MKFREGEYVKIIARESTPADAKSGLYYQHFSGLAGTVDRVYGDEVCINVDPDTLPDGISKRHLEIQESMRRKWLNGLSGEARHRLTPEERQFNLAYTILVQSSDLAKAKKGEAKPLAIKSIEPVIPADDPLGEGDSFESHHQEEISPIEVVTSPVETSEAPEPESPSTPAQAERAHSAARTNAAEKSAEKNGLTAAELAFLKEREKALKHKT